MTIFQYVGFLHEVPDILQKLSKRTRSFYRSHHRTLIDAALTKVTVYNVHDLIETQVYSEEASYFKWPLDSFITYSCTILKPAALAIESMKSKFFKLNYIDNDKIMISPTKILKVEGDKMIQKETRINAVGFHFLTGDILYDIEINPIKETSNFFSKCII